MRVTELMMVLLRSEITNIELDKSIFADLNEEDWTRLYYISKLHDLAHLVGNVVIKNNLLQNGEIRDKYDKQTITAVYRYQKIQYEFNSICKILNGAQMEFLPLKGSVIRQYYPEPWMRTSCDIDILVHEEDLKKAQFAIESQLHYKFEKKGDHDIGATAPSGVHLELHYRLNDVNIKRKSDIPLQRVWDYATEGENYCRSLRDEMFYFYHITHMAKHFENGGCGIRPFIDLWFLNRNLNCNPEEKAKLLAEGGLTTFSEVADLLSKVWLEGAEPTLISAQMEEYVLSGGVYGTQENQIAVYQNKKKGKLGYILYRIWMPYPSLCVLYPSLKGKRILQPFYEIRRWFRLSKKDTFRRNFAEFKTSFAVSDETSERTAKLLTELGLN